MAQKYRFRFTEGAMSAVKAALMGGLTDSLEGHEKADIVQFKAALDTIPPLEEMPEEIKVLMDKAKGGSSSAFMIGLAVMGAILTIGSAAGMLPVSMRRGSYFFERFLKTFRFDPDSVNRLYLRDFKIGGVSKEFWDDLKDSGLDEDHIKAVKELGQFLPPPQDVIMWAAREVFEPAQVEKYRLGQYMPSEYLKWAAKVGISGEVAEKYWEAHWALPSLQSIIDLWRRKVITKEEVDDFWTELDMVPWIREPLFKLFREVPTRVDVRRWWDMRTITEERMTDIYQSLGYWEEDLADYMLWTKVYVGFPDLIARYKNGWIGEAEVRGALAYWGMPPERIQELWETKFKAEQPGRVQKERDLTKAEIVKGVKKGVISRPYGALMLQGMGYDGPEAAFILDINIPVEKEEAELKRRELTKGDIKAAFNADIITEAQAFERLLSVRYSPDSAEFITGLWATLKGLKALKATPEGVKLKEPTKGDIVKSVKLGVRTREQGQAMLIENGYSDTAARFIMSLIPEAVELAPEELPTEDELREASKADIVRGVKLGVITAEEGYLMLLEIDFSPEAAAFILSLVPEKPEESPSSPLEIRRLVEGYKESQGMTSKEIPNEVVEAERDFMALDAKLQNAIRRHAAQDEIDQISLARTEAEYKLQAFAAAQEVEG